MIVQAVPTQYVHMTWPLVEGYLKSALDLSVEADEYNVDQLKVYVLQGEQTLLVFLDDARTIHGAVTIQWVNHPNHRVAFITAIGGKSIFHEESQESFTEWVKFNGGTKIQGAVRKSVERLCRQKLNYSPRYTIVEKIL